jgi:hypothetical protein
MKAYDDLDKRLSGAPLLKMAKVILTNLIKR